MRDSRKRKCRYKFSSQLLDRALRVSVTCIHYFTWLASRVSREAWRERERIERKGGEREREREEEGGREREGEKIERERERERG